VVIDHVLAELLHLGALRLLGGKLARLDLGRVRGGELFHGAGIGVVGLLGKG